MYKVFSIEFLFIVYQVFANFTQRKSFLKYILKLKINSKYVTKFSWRRKRGNRKVVAKDRSMWKIFVVNYTVLVRIEMVLITWVSILLFYFCQQPKTFLKFCAVLFKFLGDFFKKSLGFFLVYFVRFNKVISIVLISLRIYLVWTKANI